VPTIVGRVVASCSYANSTPEGCFQQRFRSDPLYISAAMTPTNYHKRPNSAVALTRVPFTMVETLLLLTLWVAANANLL
jgi:hypothetical protein